MKKIMGLLLMLGLLVSFGGCGKDTPTGASEEITKGPGGQTLEVWTEKYDNGKVEVEYQYYRDLEGKVVKHGYYKVYDRDGKIDSESTYKEDKLDGKYVEYGEDGKIEIESTYKEDKLDGKYVEYGEDGQIKSEENYKGNTLDGSTLVYDRDGKIVAEGEYKEGRKWNGKFVWCYENGQIKEEINYKDGELNGKFVLYDEEGNITHTECFEMGESVDCP